MCRSEAHWAQALGRPGVPGLRRANCLEPQMHVGLAIAAVRRACDRAGDHEQKIEGVAPGDVISLECRLCRHRACQLPGREAAEQEGASADATCTDAFQVSSQAIAAGLEALIWAKWLPSGVSPKPEKSQSWWSVSQVRPGLMHRPLGWECRCF